MLSFENDYSEGAHEDVLRRLCDTNRIQQVGYGEDDFSAAAKNKIRAACQAPDADVFFLVGGTQTNAVVIDSLLHATEGVVSAVTGHVNQHEAGAIEFTGHKVIPLPAHAGKIDAGELRALLQAFYADPSHEHMVFPGMVYISHPTEYGTLYTKAELAALSRVCREYEMPLYLDGARLGYGLMSRDTDVDLPLIAALCDAFYIGGTKVGALCGEAVVFPRHGAPKRFVTQIKQHGAMLAKGRLTGLQFDALFTDGLYFRLGQNAIDRAEEMKKGFARRGFSFFLDSPTNQQFVILTNEQMEKIGKTIRFSFWERLDEHRAVVRFATSWATRPEDVSFLMDALDTLSSASR